jgi:hypothetical protein
MQPEIQVLISHAICVYDDWKSASPLLHWSSTGAAYLGICAEVSNCYVRNTFFCFFIAGQLAMRPIITRTQKLSQQESAYSHKNKCGKECCRIDLFDSNVCLFCGELVGNRMAVNRWWNHEEKQHSNMGLLIYNLKVSIPRPWISSLSRYSDELMAGFDSR